MRLAVRLLERHDINSAGEEVLLDEDLAAVLVAYRRAEWPGVAPAGSEYSPRHKFEDVGGEKLRLVPNFEDEARERKARRGA